MNKGYHLELCFSERGDRLDFKPKAQRRDLLKIDSSTEFTPSNSSGQALVRAIPILITTIGMRLPHNRIDAESVAASKPQALGMVSNDGLRLNYTELGLRPAPGVPEAGMTEGCRIVENSIRVDKVMSYFVGSEVDFFEDFFFHFFDHRIDFGGVDFALGGRAMHVDVSFMTFGEPFL